MPTLLRELLDEANIHTNGSFPSQQISTKATIIEPLDMEAAPALRTKYTSLMESNNIIEPQAPTRNIRTPINPPMSYQMNNQNNFSPNLNIRSLTEEQRIQSLNAAQSIFMNSAAPMAGLLAPPQSAGEISPMKQFVSQPSMPMKIREGFRSRQQGQQSCIDTLNHISSCPMCSRYFECDAKVYHVIIFMLIVLFLTILYFVCKEEHKFGK
jgi:hypothetical protein